MLQISLLAVLLLFSTGNDEKPAPSPIDKVRVLDKILSKGSPSSAWGAYYAGKIGLKDSIPALLKLVTRENQRNTGPVPIVKKAALDALIRLDADVPGGLLSTGLHKDYLAETLILLAKNPDKNRDALFSLMDYGPVEGQHWWAAAGILASLKPKGLTERMLAEVRLTLSITVRDQGTDHDIRYFEGFGSGGVWGCTSNLFPPKPTYILSTEPKKAQWFSQAKPITIYFQRSEGARDGITAGTVGPQTRTIYVIQFLLAMLDKPLNDFPITGKSFFKLDWVSEHDYIEKVKSQLDLLRLSYKRLLDMLSEQNLLTLEVSKNIDPMIKLKVHDQRENKNTPLPTISMDE